MRDFKAYPLKEISLINANTIVLKFYLTFADWDISNDIFEIEIIGEGIDKYINKLNTMIGIAISVEEEENGILTLWEGEYEHERSTDTLLPFESYQERFVPKSVDDWKQQYLSLVDHYYNYRRKHNI